MLRASVAISFLLSELKSLALLLGAGQVSANQCWAALALSPVVAVGTWLSRVRHARIGGKGLGISVLVFAAVSGLFLMARAQGG